MCQNLIGKTEMDISAAREQHSALLGRLMRGAGGIDAAMHAADRMYGLPYWSQWNLRAKRRATAAFMDRIRQAYLAALETSVRRDLERLKAEEAKGSRDAGLTDLVAEAQDILARIAERAS